MEQERIKILYTIPNFSTAGSGRSVYDLVRKIDKSRFEPEICVFHTEGVFFKEVEKLNVKIHVFPFTANYRPRIKFLSKVFKIRKFFKENKFDIIHSWHWSSDISEPLAARLAGIPFVYTKKAMGWKSKFWKLRSQLSSRIIVVNEDMVSAYFANMLHMIEKFPLAIDVEHYQPEMSSDSLKKELGIKPEDFVIISVANLVKVKGIETLLEAVKLLNNTNVKVIIVGSDSDSYAKNIKLRYKSWDQVQFLGKQLDVRPYLSISDLFVIPTKDEGRREGIPNAPLEAMAMERIVLGSNISGIRDILEVFPENLFQADNSQELGKKIKKIILMRPSERNELEKQMRERVVNVFDIKAFINKHQILYQKLIANKK